MIEWMRGAATDSEAATMVEYALLICLCALICLVTISAMGGNLAARYNAVSSALTTSGPPACQNSNGSAASKNPNC